MLLDRFNLQEAQLSDLKDAQLIFLSPPLPPFSSSKARENEHELGGMFLCLFCEAIVNTWHFDRCLSYSDFHRLLRYNSIPCSATLMHVAFLDPTSQLILLRRATHASWPAMPTDTGLYGRHGAMWRTEAM